MADCDTARGPAGDGQRRCTYCFQELNEMTDPRQLPCTHVVCLPCLENDWKLDELQCRACSKHFTVGNLAQLPQVSVGKTAETETEESPHVEYHACDFSERPFKAVVYCVNCDKKFCNEHIKSHTHLYKDDHKTIKIGVFAERENYYANVLCDQHTNEFIQFICKRCGDMRCLSCLSESGICKSGGSHQYRSIERARSNVESEFDQLLAELSEKMKILFNLEKNTWQKVDRLAETCDTMLRQVEELTVKKIEEVQKKSTDMKKAILNYQETQLAKAEDYIRKLLSNVDSFESSQNFVASLLKGNHVTEVVKQQRKITDDILARKNSCDTSEFSYQMMELIVDDQGDLELSSKDESEQADRTSKVPVFLWNSILLKHFAPLTRGSICPTISFNEIGELIFGFSENVLLSERKTYTWREPKEIKFPGKTV